MNVSDPARVKSFSARAPFYEVATLEEVYRMSTLNSMFARLGTDYEIRNQGYFTILEAMTTD